MILVIDTQYMENYGAHDWDGQGSCPQYWKMKGGEEYMVTGIPNNCDVALVLRMLGQEVEWSDHGSRSYVLGTHFESDGYLSEFERSQQEYDGQITFAAPRIAYTDLCVDYQAREAEYADLAADLDAIYYGA
jgi:hypothetical protein